MTNSYPVSFFSFQATLTRFPFLDKLQHSKGPVITQHAKHPGVACVYVERAHTSLVEAHHAAWRPFSHLELQIHLKFSFITAPLKRLPWVEYEEGEHLSKAYSCIWCNTCSLCGKHYCYTHILILSDQHTACTLGEKVKSHFILVNTWRLKISHVGLRMAVKHSLKTKDGATKKDCSCKEGVNSEEKGGVDKRRTGGSIGASL